MKFKQQEDKEDKFPKEIEASFTKLLQIEEDKLSLIEAAISYFYMQGKMDYKKFLKYLHKICIDAKMCLQDFLYEISGKTPERIIHELKLDDFTEDIKFFELLVSAEDDYIDEVNNIINLAYNNKQWKIFHYFLKQYDNINHLCCKAENIVKTGGSLVNLIPCELHSSEK